jgi:hypothetical protein
MFFFLQMDTLEMSNRNPESHLRKEKKMKPNQHITPL